MEATAVSKIRVAMADPHRLYGEAIQQMLVAEGVDVIAVCVTGEEALTAVADLDPSLVLVDTGLPDISGIELGRLIVEQHPSVKVVLIAPNNEPALTRDALVAGLHGFITRQSSIKQLMASLHAVLEGNIVMPPRSITDNAAPRRSDAAVFAAAFHLTPRERDVLSLLTKGSSSKEIAKSLSLRPNTVRTHVQNVLTKLQVHSRLEAAAVANRMGLVDSDGNFTRK